LWRIIEARLGLGAAGATVQGMGTRLAPQPSRLREGLAWAAAAAALLGALWSHQTAQKTASSAQRERSVMEESLANTSGQLASAEAARKACATALAQLTQQGAFGREAVSMLEQPATKLAPFGPAGTQTYRATALFNPETKRAVVISTTVPRIEGKDYELWVIAAGQAPVPAGFLRFDPSGVAIGEFDSALLRGATPAALAVSLEPLGGRPTPTEVVLVAKLSG
jgi:anti-sigma-K factor RskA